MKVQDLEKKRTETESQISQFLGQFKTFQKRLQSVISDLPETIQETLGTLFNMIEPFLRQTVGAHDELVAIEGRSITAEYAQESSIKSVVSKRKRDDKESAAVDLLEEEKRDTVTFSQNSKIKNKNRASKYQNADNVKQEILTTVVNTVQETKQSVQSSETETKQCTHQELSKYKEISTQIADSMLQSAKSSCKTADDKQANLQSNPASASPASQEPPCSPRYRIYKYLIWVLVGIEKSFTRVTDRHHEARLVMPNSDQ